MEALKKAGFRVIPVTGRPAGWCDHIARFWPVDAVVGENGAFWMWHDDQGAASCARASCRARPSGPRAGAGWRRCAPRCCATCRAPASPPTSPIALADLAIDFCEDVPPLPRDDDRAHRDDLRGAWRARQGELDPRQRLVRRLRQAHDQPADDAASCSASISRSEPRSLRLRRAIRPTTRRCSASFPMPWAWPMSATSPPTWTTCRAGSRLDDREPASPSWQALSSPPAASAVRPPAGCQNGPGCRPGSRRRSAHGRPSRCRWR